MIFQVIDQTDLYLIFCIGTFIVCLLTGRLGGIGSDVYYTCPLFEAG